MLDRRYAGVDGYEDDGMNTYRAQAIRKDILDWDIDDTTLDNVTLADPKVVLGSTLPSLLALSSACCPLPLYVYEPYHLGGLTVLWLLHRERDFGPV